MKIKKAVKISAAICFLLCVFVFSSFAASKNGVTTGSVNIRSGPGTTHSIIYNNLPANTQVVVIETVKCDDGSTSKDWCKLEFNYNGQYYENCYASVAYINILSDSSVGGDVPTVYQSYISKLKSNHPNWTFQFLYTDLSWDEVLKNENVSGRSLIQSPPYLKKYLSTTDSSYDPSTGTWKPLDGKTWYQASSNVVSYYLDPRNFLSSEDTIFQFELLSYDKDNQTLAGIQQMLKGTFMENGKIYTDGKPQCDLNGDNKTDCADAMILFQYVAGNTSDLGNNSSVADINADGEINVADAMLLFQFVGGSISNIGTSESITYASAFLEAAKQTNVSPYHLASRVIQEVGTSGSNSTSGTTQEYPGIYNYYNIGASSSSNPILNGLKWASTPDASNEKYLRPWDSPYKSIIGGAKFIANGYIDVGQNTLYLQKFDVVANGGLYWHQYMTNIMAANSEGSRTYKKYKEMNQLSNSFTFIIPVYNNMPSSPAGTKPTTS